MELQDYTVIDPSGRERIIQGPKGASDEEVIAQAQKLFMAPKPRVKEPIETPAFEREAAKTLEKPTTGALAWNSAMKGLAAVPDALMNTPTNIYNLGKAAVGTAATAMGRSDLAPELTANPDLAKRGLLSMGAMSPYAEPATAGQRLLDAGIQGGVSMLMAPANTARQLGTNALYGSTSAAAGEATKEATGSPLAGAAVSMLTPFVLDQANVSAIRRLDNLQGRQAQRETLDNTLRESRDAGLVFQPTHINENAGLFTRALESIGGKAALRQEAERRNAPVAQRLVAEELGFPPNTALTPQRLNAYRNQQAQPYRELAQISPRAAFTLENLQQARDAARNAWREYNGPNHPRAALNDARTADAQVARLEATLDQQARQAGRPDLVPAMQTARTNIAKSHDIERALNRGDSTVNAMDFGRAMDSGAQLTGNLGLLGRAALANNTRQAMGEATSTPGVSNLGANVAAHGLGSAVSGSPTGFFQMGVPLLSGPARSLLLSNFYQNSMMPNYAGGYLTRGLAGMAQPSPSEMGLAGLLGALRQSQQ